MGKESNEFKMQNIRVKTLYECERYENMKG